jgi:hypothetical protein
MGYWSEHPGPLTVREAKVAYFPFRIGFGNPENFGQQTQAMNALWLGFFHATK